VRCVDNIRERTVSFLAFPLPLPLSFLFDSIRRGKSGEDRESSIAKVPRRVQLKIHLGEHRDRRSRSLSLSLFLNDHHHRTAGNLRVIRGKKKQKKTEKKKNVIIINARVVEVANFRAMFTYLCG